MATSGGSGGDLDGTVRLPPPPKRTPPPDHTGEEARYLQELKDNKTPVVVVLSHGEEIHGWVEYYDREMIKVNRVAGPNLFVRKADIRYLHEDKA